MAQETAKRRKTSNAYNIFILVLTVLSLAVRDCVKIMVAEMASPPRAVIMR
jgi:hypothetical protein